MTKLQTGRPSKKDKVIASVQQQLEENTIRMNINIDKSFHKKIKQLALDNETNITEIVKKALKDYMKK